MKYALGRTVLALTVTALSLTLAACGGGGGSGGGSSSSGSTTSPDRQTETPASSTDTSSVALSGRVVDGYLRYATVWLDLDNDFILDPNEPSTKSQAGGKFSFTANDLVGINDPKKYPLMVHALAGTTVDEDLIQNGDESSGLIELPFFLAAPPGITNVTPLTTLVKLQHDALLADPTATAAMKTVATAHTRVQSKTGLALNLMQDYVAIPNGKLHAFAKGLVATLQLNLESSSTDPSASLTSLDSMSVSLIGRALLTESRTVLDFVELKLGLSPNSQTAANTNFLYDFEYPILTEALANPEVLYRERWYAHPETYGHGYASVFSWTEDNAPLDQLKQIADVNHTYSITRNLTSTSVDGLLSLSLVRDAWQGAIPEVGFDGLFPVETTDGELNYRIDNSFKNSRTHSSKLSLLRSEGAPDELVAMTEHPTTYLYNAEGQLDSVTYRTAFGSQTQYHRYDADGKLGSIVTTPRAEGSDESEITFFFYDAEKRAESTNHFIALTSDIFSGQSGLLINPDEFLVPATLISQSFYVYGDSITSICTITVSPDDSDYCWHNEFENARLKYLYLELVAHGEPFLGRQQGGAIAVIAEFEYQPLLSVAR